MNIFISYTVKDKEVSLNNLRAISIKLKQIGNVYIDIINNDSLNRRGRVFYELDNSDIVILIISPSVYQSKWVNIELERAKKLLIPIVPFTIKEIKTLDLDLINKMLLPPLSKTT